MIRPEPCARMTGATRSTMRMTPSTLTSNIAGDRVDVEFLARPRAWQARIVHQDVDAAEPFEHGRHGALDGGGVRHVQGERHRGVEAVEGSVRRAVATTR